MRQGGATMTTPPKSSPAEIFAEMAQLLADWCKHLPWAIVIVVIAWMIPPLGALVTTLLVFHIYSTREGSQNQPMTVNISWGRIDQSRLLVVFGAILIAVGIFGLIRYLLHFELPWSIVVIALGILLILLGASRRSSDEPRKDA
jgi:hypothetical protein